jgi:hypothetical protein
MKYYLQATNKQAVRLKVKRSLPIQIILLKIDAINLKNKINV